MLEGDSKIFRKKPETPTFHSGFSEGVISAVRADIRMALMKCLLGGGRNSDIRISEGYIYYQDLEGQNLKWIQEVIILLETTGFLYKHDQIDTSVLDSQVFGIPSIAEMNNDSNDKKLEYMRFCLSRSFKILLDKLSQKKSITPLTLGLFVKTCLYLQREQVPIYDIVPELAITGTSWIDLARRCLYPEGEEDAELREILSLFVIEYPALWAEIQELYAKSFTADIVTTYYMRSHRNKRV